VKINFVLRCYDKEEYIPYALAVINSYWEIEPSIVLCYDGVRKDVLCDVKIPSQGKQCGDANMIYLGYLEHKLRNDNPRFLSMCVDSFLMDEDVIIRIFNEMEAGRCGYAGNNWNHEGEPTLATDIIFADLRFGNVFEFDQVGMEIEFWMYNHCMKKGIKPLIIKERIPVHPDNRFQCEKLKWTMHHTLKENLDNMRRWKAEPIKV